MRVRARALTGFSTLVEGHGGDPHALMKQLGVNPSITDAPDETLPLEQLARLLDHAATSLAVPDFGLQLAQHQDISVLGSVALIARHSETVAHAMQGIARHLPYHTPGASLELDQDAKPGYVRMRYQLNLAEGVPRQQIIELSYAVAYQALLLVTSDHGRGWAISFRHQGGLTAAKYRKHFEGSVALGQPVDAMAIPAHLLGCPIDPNNAELRSMAERFVGNIVRRHPLDAGQQVMDLARRQLANGGGKIARVAEQMGLHTRTLQRRLASQGLCFEDLIDGIRKDLAQEYLVHDAIPLSQVASLLGYAEPSSFNRACRRWFGATPQRYRDQAGQLVSVGFAGPQSGP